MIAVMEKDILMKRSKEFNLTILFALYNYSYEILFNIFLEMGDIVQAETSELVYLIP